MFTRSSESRTLVDKYPRLANMFLQPTLSMEEATSLSRWDTVIVGLELQYTSPSALQELKRLNSDIVILAYVLSQEIPNSYGEITDTDDPHYQLYQGFQEDWWLKDSSGDTVVFWPNTKMINVTPTGDWSNSERWYNYLPQFMHDNVMSTGYWDGIFYDNMWNDISWLNDGDIDLNRDGVAETSSVLDSAWREGMSNLLEKSRELEGDGAIIVGNGGGQYFSSVNGRLVEEFPSVLDGGWSGAMDKYYDAIQQSFLPSLVIINGRSSTGSATDYKNMRYTLTSTLMNDGFFSYDKGSIQHNALWWYDEFQVILGDPSGEAYNVDSGSTSDLSSGVCRRDFQNGIVLVNSSGQTRSVNLGGGYEKIKGSQDTTVNSGEIITSVQLAGHDGIILLKRQFEIESGQYINGAYAQSFDPLGNTVRHGFFTYNSDYAGGLTILKEDLDQDGNNEIIVGWSGKVQIYNSSGFLTKEFQPYGSNYDKGINLAVGELYRNGKLEIVTGTGQGGGPHVRIFDYQGNLIHPGFFAYAEHFRGGVNVTVGDVDKDGKNEIITGAGYTGGPHIRVFDRDGNVEAGFFAYDERFRGGVSVAVTDVNNDGMDEIITGAGPGGGPHVRILDRFGNMVLPGFFAYDLSYRGGVQLTISDVDNDGSEDILALTTSVY